MKTCAYTNSICLLASLFAMGQVLMAPSTLSADVSSAVVGSDPSAPTDIHPYQVVLASSEVQDQVVSGHPDALARQIQVTRDIARKLAGFDLQVWTNGRNRAALIKFVLNGGDVDILETVLSKAMFPEGETALAQGILQYAMGRTAAAAEILASVDVRAFGSSLAGHIALVKAILARQTDPEAALRYSSEARLLSLGTAIEEAALRLSIDLAIARGDAMRFDVCALRYAYRFPKSLYRSPIDRRVARVLGVRPAARQADVPMLARTLGAQLADGDRLTFYTELAESALRAGHVATAETMAKSAAELTAHSDVSARSLRAIEGAAALFSGNRATGLHLLAQTEGPDPPDTTKTLLSEVRKLAASIEAPPQRLPPGAMVEAPPADPVIPADKHLSKSVGAKLENNDRIVRRTSADATKKMTDVDELLHRVGP